MKLQLFLFRMSTLQMGIKKPGAGAAGQILSYNLETEE